MDGSDVLFVWSLTENLVPNVILELFFVLQLLTSRTPPITDEEEEDQRLCLVRTGERCSITLRMELRQRNVI